MDTNEKTERIVNSSVSEFSSYEETEDGTNVEFTIFREQSRDPNSSDYKVIN